ncbi:unnamed protein product [Phyllotreta striolata]|uniref:C2H2-type domain-containing protein n=1 Tax=Phyllotreta striolata TaxID=444603 RepID=A0A9N9TX96_PHYSR|nr:unnamed protein product [Phyllotreta striolata]
MPQFQRNIIITIDDNKFICRRCGKVFTSKHLVVTHILYECGKQSVFQCPLCPRKCKRNDVLQSHLKNIHRID